MMVFNCKACGKPIVFITTVAGKKMPCDAMVRAYEPDADGPDTIITKDGQTVRGQTAASWGVFRTGQVAPVPQGCAKRGIRSDFC